MNFKLKGIELDAFRIYQEKQIFNFLTNLGEVANLIVIYAPNGYGKTSFIDGVEWALTGSINRISKNTILKNTADNEKGLILKNIKSDKDFGTVKLIAENGGLLEKKTKVVRGNRKTDYADGDIVVKSDIFKNINATDFSTKSLLGQDKIDGFLRSVSPKDRYDTLTNFWDDENDSELFKSILSLHSESEKQFKQVKDDLKEITNEIQSLVMRPSITWEINNLVEKFNEIKLKGLSLPKLNPDNNKQFINVLIETNSKLESAIEDKEKKLSTSQYLVEEFEVYNNNKDKIDKIKEDIKTIKGILGNFKKRDEQSDSLKSVVYDAYNLHEKYRKLKKLTKLYSNSTAIQKKIKDFEEKNSTVVKEISTTNSEKTEQEHILNKIKASLDNLKQSKNDLDNHYIKLDINLKSYFNISRKKSHLSKRLLLLKNMISIRQNEIHDYKKQILTLNSYNRYEVENILNIKTENAKINNLVRDIGKYYKFIQQKKIELKELNQEYNRFGKLNEQINTIYKVGKRFIEETRTTSCPLCKKEYNDFDELIREVDRDFIEIDILNKLKDEIINLELVIKNKKNDLDNLTDTFRKEIDNELHFLLILDTQCEAKITSYNSLNQRMNNKLNNIKEEESELIRYFNQLEIKIENKSNKDIANIKNSTLEKINKLSITILDYQNKERETSEGSKNLITKLQQKEVEYVSNKNRIRELKEDPILKSFNQLLNELKIEGNIEKIKETSDIVKEKFLLKVKHKRIISNQINNLDIELNEVNKQETNDKYMELQKCHQEVQDYINKYNLKLNQLIKSNSASKEEVIQTNDNFTYQIRLDKSALTILTDLMGFSNYIEKNIESKTKGSKKRELEDKLVILKKSSEELSNAKEYITNYIEEKINNSFNLESINNLYQRIDPHPDFNKIKFETDLSKDKPEINIYASDSREKLAPILYFSAAQVNILSLSIFLAKALLKDQDGLNTIFMDDPIQHLDNLNILSFIDLLRTITNQLDKQVILSTHNENFYKLIKRKMAPEYTKSKFIELESFGKIKNH